MHADALSDILIWKYFHKTADWSLKKINIFDFLIIVWLHVLCLREITLAFDFRDKFGSEKSIRKVCIQKVKTIERVWK
jgi:hypothetical protein